MLGMKMPTASGDVAFARKMIEHHQMAISMSRRLLASSRDPQLRNLANDIIKAQQPEIDFLKRWLALRGVRA